jgi:hypothetical protein
MNFRVATYGTADPWLSRGISIYSIWIADAHRRDGTRFVVRAEEKLTTFF